MEKVKKRFGWKEPGMPQVIAVLLVVGVLFAAGWFLYEPAYNWIMNLAQTEEPEPAPPESSAAEPAPEQPQQPEPVPENWSEELRAVWIPASAAANSTMLESYLATLPADTTASPWELELPLPQLPQLELEAEIHWAEGSPENAVSITLEPAQKEPRTDTRWTGEDGALLHDLFLFSW